MTKHNIELMIEEEKTAEELLFELDRLKKENKELRVLLKSNDFTEINRSHSSLSAKTPINIYLKDISQRWNDYRHFFENSSVGFFRTTPNGYFIDANPALIKMLGYNSFEELVQVNLEGDGYVLHAYRRDLFRKMIEEKGEIIGWETAWVRNDGRMLYIRENAKAVKDSSGQVVFYEGTLEDISEKKNIEIELKESEAKLAEAQRIARLGSWEYYPETEKLIWSEETFRIAGIQPAKEAPSLEEYLKMIHPKDIYSFKNKIIQSVSEGKELQTEFRQFRPDGEICHIYIMCRPVFEKNKVVRLFGTAVDITEPKRAQEAVRLSEIRYRTLAENFPDGAVLMFDSDLRFIIADGEELSKFGIAGKSILGRHFSEVFITGDFKTLHEYLVQTLKGDKNVFDIRYNNSIYQFQTVPVRSSSEKKITAGMIIIQDVTERRNTEEKLKELNASKDKFFSIIAHDLRSPFTSLLGLSEFMVNDLEELNKDEIRNFALSIYRSSKNIFNLLENLLQWARMQIGHMEFDPVAFSLNDLVTDTISLYQINALRKNIQIRSKFNGRYKVSADKNMIQAILRNLISNAVKFSNHGKEITVSLTEQEGEIIASIEDNGIGIDNKIINNLFKAGECASRSGTDNEKGSGLGLVLCREFVEKNGGRIWAESIPGKGSIFSFSLPMLQ